MSKKEDLLMSYIYNRRIYLENEVKQLRENIRWRPVDAVDCLELVIALERLNIFIEVSRDIREILKLKTGIPP